MCLCFSVPKQRPPANLPPESDEPGISRDRQGGGTRGTACWPLSGRLLLSSASYVPEEVKPGGLRLYLGLLKQCFSECGLRTSGISIPGELVRKANSWSPPPTLLNDRQQGGSPRSAWSQTLPSGGPQAHGSYRALVWRTLAVPPGLLPGTHIRGLCSSFRKTPMSECLLDCECFRGV